MRLPVQEAQTAIQAPPPAEVHRAVSLCWEDRASTDFQHNNRHDAVTLPHGTLFTHRNKHSVNLKVTCWFWILRHIWRQARPKCDGVFNFTPNFSFTSAFSVQTVPWKPSLRDIEQKRDQVSRASLSRKLDGHTFCDAYTVLIASWLKHATAGKCWQLQKLPQNFKLNI